MFSERKEIEKDEKVEAGIKRANYDMDLEKGLRLLAERLFVERSLADGQLMEEQYVEITEFQVYKIFY